MLTSDMKRHPAWWSNLSRFVARRRASEVRPSRNSLQSYELKQLSHAANLRKEISALLDQWLEENASAMLARWLMEQRERPSHSVDGPSAEAKPHGAHSVSDNFYRGCGGSTIGKPRHCLNHGRFSGPKCPWPLVVALLLWFAALPAGVPVIPGAGAHNSLARAFLDSASHSPARPPASSRSYLSALIARLTHLRNGCNDIY